MKDLAAEFNVQPQTIRKRSRNVAGIVKTGTARISLKFSDSAKEIIRERLTAPNKGSSKKKK